MGLTSCVNINDPKVIKLAEGLGESPQVAAALIGAMQEQRGDMEYFPDLIDLVVYKNEGNKKIKTTKPMKFYSGGAKGSDIMWGQIAKKIGHEVDHILANRYSDMDYAEQDMIEEQYQEVVKELGRRPLPADTYPGMLVRRDMMQANYSNGVIAIAESLSKDNKSVNGGTGYATMASQMQGKPVFVFNQMDNKWYEFDGDKYVQSKSKPVIQDGMALVGTRQINEHGVKAIESVFDIDSQDSQPLPSTRPDRTYLHELDYAINPISKKSLDQKKLALSMTPVDIRNRTKLLSDLFSQYVHDLVQLRKDAYAEELSNATTKLYADIIKDKMDNMTVNSIMKEYGPVNIFQMIKEDVFGGIVNMSKEEYVDVYYDENIDAYEELGYTEEQAEEDAVKNSGILHDKYSLIYNNFDALMVLSGPFIQENEHIKINFISGDFVEDTDNSVTDLDGNDVQSESSMEVKEEHGKEGWQAEARSVSLHDSLSKAVKQLIRSIPQTNTKGEVLVDDLNMPKTLDPTFVYAVLMKELSVMTSYKDFLPLMDRLENTYSWLGELNRRMREDPAVVALFYKNFRADHINYSGMAMKQNADGSYNVTTYDINKSGGNALLGNWRSNIQSGNILNSKMSLYKRDGLIDLEAAKQIAEAADSIQSKLKMVDKEALPAFLELHPKIVENIKLLLGTVGVEVSTDDLMGIVARPMVNQGEIKMFNNSSNNLITAIRTIANNAKKIDFDSDFDIINEFNSQYRAIQNILADIDTDSLESSFREGGKTRYAHTSPCYLLKIVKELSDSTGLLNKFDEFIQSQYGDVSFFKTQGGQWLNQWLKELAEDPELRKQFRHSVLLTVDKTEYATWSPNTYYTALINQYFSEETLPGKNKYAKYYVPIMSDAQSAEFIRFKRYVGEQDEFGNKGSFKDQMRPMYRNLLKQELNRMVTVAKRANAVANGENIKPIANYDIKAKAGQTYSVNDVKFSFLTRLNGMTINGNPIQGELVSMISNKDTNVNALMDQLIEDIMQLGFQDLLEDMNKYNVLDQAENGKLKNFTFMNNQNYLEMLEEYYWNSSLATALIVQLTTTDFAFYKGPEDFQKRFKEIHSPAKRLYVDAEFNYTDPETGLKETLKPASKEYKTVLLKDDEDFKSTAYDNIRTALLDRVENGAMTKMDMDAILNKFDGINVADAQAYRTLESFRDVYIMGGLWTNEMEKAFRNMKSGKWEAADFYVLWQPIKPFVFTLNVTDSKVGNKIKVPAQYKNSEYLLMALFNMAAGPIGLSPKLKAINQYMVDNNIDVVQFESTTKVGKHGVVNINDVESFEDTMNALNTLTKIGDQLNDLVVLASSYEDYGIQVETPEHMIDHSGLRGTQITKLITSDIADGTVFNVDGKNITKEELIHKYNEILVSLAMNDEFDVKELISNEEELSRLIAEEISGSARHGNNMLQSVLLNENGRITIPLNEKSHSLRVLNTLNSIIKSRITKQKIAGGALIQATAYGLTNELNIVFKDDDGVEYLPKHKWLALNPGATDADYAEYSKKGTSIAYIESYMPWYTAEYFAPLLKEGTHELDPSKITDKSLLDVIGYRI